jgi:uncharacterized protein (TIGR03435 family)
MNNRGYYMTTRILRTILHTSIVIIAALSTPLPALRAQSPAAKLSFDVASIKQNTSDLPAYRATSNFPLGLGESYPPNGSLLSATNYPVATYIAFAYKLTSSEQRTLQAQLPKWTNDQRFDIEARAPGIATKDQMRLMMQSLLADRFKLAVHNEIKEAPVYALVLVKPGETGPQLHARAANSPACGAFSTSAAARSADGTPSSCDVFLTLVDTDRIHTSARNITMRMIAGAMPLPGLGQLDHPVVDQTGLTGTFDFTIECSPEPTALNAQTNEIEPTFLQALKDQLGLKLESSNTRVTTLVIDHIDPPSPN